MQYTFSNGKSNFSKGSAQYSGSIAALHTLAAKRSNRNSTATTAIELTICSILLPYFAAVLYIQYIHIFLYYYNCTYWQTLRKTFTYSSVSICYSVCYVKALIRKKYFVSIENLVNNKFVAALNKEYYGTYAECLMDF
jgi:hypothetical protein